MVQWLAFSLGDREVLGSNPRHGGVDVKCTLTCCKDLEQVLHSLVARRVVLVALETCGHVIDIDSVITGFAC